MDNLLFAEVGSQLENLPRRERQNLRQRRGILDAALRLFSEKGYNNVSMHEIAGEAEFGIGTLYKFFTNKEDLYKALIMEVAKTWHRVLMQALEQESSPLRAIKKYIAVRRKLFSENLPIMRLYFAETRGASFNIRAGLDQDLLRLYDEGIEKLASIFEKGIKDHVFRHLDPYQMALALDGTINALLFRIMNDPARFRDGDNLSTAADIFFRGVLSKPEITQGLE
jgi:TetR/AcrR family transcriptional regulator